MQKRLCEEEAAHWWEGRGETGEQEGGERVGEREVVKRSLRGENQRERLGGED